VSLLDVATGSADVPLAVWQWFDRTGLRLDVAGLDSSSAVLAEARRTLGANAPIHLVQGDARALPLADGAVDITTCCLALHHFPPGEAERVLAEMWRVSRRAIVVVDLIRSYPAYIGTWLVTHTLARSRLTRHDGPLSVLRAYTEPELEEMAAGAGVRGARVRHRFPFRMTLVAQKEPSGG
jgi:SAM-dependent methyltransferase